MFDLDNTRGFGMTFENGVRISVKWGYGSYSDNYMVEDDVRRLCGGQNRKLLERAIYKPLISKTAEIGIMKNGELITNEWLESLGEKDANVVAGEQSADWVAQAMEWAKNYK